MTNLTLSISWEWALGIIGLLILGAWKANGRFTALETSMDWVKETLRDLKVSSDNAATPAFGAHSPVNLNPTGESWLMESGIKEYVDRNKEVFLKECEDKRSTNPYEVQKQAFRIFDDLVLEPQFEDRLKKLAYEKGTTMAMMRRIGGIYLRNICLDEFGMQREDIDRHDPEVGIG